MSMFNEYQREWMAYLASLPRESKCDCGWDRRGECSVACYGKPECGGAVPKDKDKADAEATGEEPR